MLDDAERVQTPLLTGQRIAFASLLRGAGVSTLAALVSQSYASRRQGRVLLTAAAGDGSSAIDLLASRTPPGTGTADAGDAAIAHLPHRSGLWAATIEDLMPGTVLTRRERSQTPAAMRERLVPLYRYFEVISTDWGVRAEVAELEEISDFQRLCLVSPFERSAAEHTIAVAKHLAGRDPGAAVTIVFIDRGRTRSTWPSLVAPRLRFPAMTIAHDRRLSSQGRSTRISRTTRRSLLAVAGSLIAQQQHREDPS